MCVKQAFVNNRARDAPSRLAETRDSVEHFSDVWYNLPEDEWRVVNEMKALILAAGYATRLYPLTENMPKALLPIGGRAMIEYLMDAIARIGEIDEAIIISNHRFAAQFFAWAQYASQKYPQLKLTVLDDGTTGNENRLGAIGDIQFALDQLGVDEDVLIAASDNFFTFDLDGYIADFRSHGKDLLFMQRMEDYEERKRFAIATLDADMRVVKIEEKPEHPETDIAGYALYIYRRDTLPLFRRYLDGKNNPDSPGNFPVWLHREKEVRAYLFGGECVDIGTHETYQQICEKYRQK